MVTLITVEVVMSHVLTQLKLAAKLRLVQYPDLNRYVAQESSRQYNCASVVQIACAHQDKDMSVW
jgi:S-adenosylmethionine:diacylglycerol 3-amino-3-carboxypropyl transferase